MAVIRPFRAVRPAPSYAADAAALPYDVYSREEAAEAVKGHPVSFLNIDRPETMFETGHDMYAPEVYEAARGRYEAQKDEGIYLMDPVPCYYIYELTMDGRVQTGICALSSVDDYLSGVCRKHENTVAAKELDRIHHVDAMSAQTGPIFLAYHADPRIDELIADWKNGHTPVADFVSEDLIKHKVYVIDEPEAVDTLSGLFGELAHTYIADGHHRAASAVKVALKRREEAEAAGSVDPEAEYNFFLSVLFPDDQLKILDYNRIVRDLAGLTKKEFLEKLAEYFDITHAQALRPIHKYDIGMYLDKEIYTLSVKDFLREETAGDPVKSLDVSILQEKVLSPILGIQDPRTDKRIEFVGGIRGIGELMEKTDKYDSEAARKGTLDQDGPAVAFAMYPTDIAELLAVADAGLLMPPKSTWFEPKLRSGLFIHEF